MDSQNTKEVISAGQSPKEVIVVDIRMRFLSMVIFMVKWVIASIPALMILALLWATGVFLLHWIAGGTVVWRTWMP